jgi:predicted DNA-binding protein (MmcQ/YjbR family)
MFALLILTSESRINLKCDPERAIELREEHEFIIPGYHMNKKHWNTIALNDCGDDKLLKDLITHSYGLVVNSLTRKLRNELELL